MEEQKTGEMLGMGISSYLPIKSGQVEIRGGARRGLVAKEGLFGKRAARFLSVPWLQVTPLRDSRRFCLSGILSGRGFRTALSLLGEGALDALASSKCYLSESADFDLLVRHFPISYVRPAFEVLGKLGPLEQNMAEHTLRLLEFLEILEIAERDEARLDDYLRRKGDQRYVGENGLLPAKGAFLRVAEIYRSLRNRKILWIAALLHDYGKTIDGPNHAEAGYNLVLGNRSLGKAIRIALGKEYNRDTLLQIAHLVRLHAFFSDVEDGERSIFQLVWQNARLPLRDKEEFEKMLFLLSVADKMSFAEHGYVTPENLETLFEILGVVHDATRQIAASPPTFEGLVGVMEARVRLSSPRLFPEGISADRYGRYRFLHLVEYALDEEGVRETLRDLESQLKGTGLSVNDFFEIMGRARNIFWLPIFLRNHVSERPLRIKIVIWAVLAMRRFGEKNMFFFYDRRDPERREVNQMIEIFRGQSFENIFNFFSCETGFFEGENILNLRFTSSLPG